MARFIKCGAIYSIPMDLVIAGLKAIRALPRNAKCSFREEPPAALEIKANDDALPLVREGQPYPRRNAVAGHPTGEPC